MEDGRRNLVVCAEDTAAAATACRWVVDHMYKEGDRLHLLYVVKAMMPPMEVFHSLPGTAYSFGQPGRHDEDAVIAAAKAAIEARYLPILTPKMVPYELHLYAERKDASAQRVGETIVKCAEERDAPLVVLAAHNKPSPSDNDH
jgi:nucleotide-binding universal stress UspA family protein